MMDFVQQFLSDHSKGLIDTLVGKLGFSADQAQSFLPAAVRRIVDAVKGNGADVGALVKGFDITALTSKIDLQSLASETGIDVSKATEGVRNVAPSLLSALKGKAGSAESLLGGLGGKVGGALDAAASAGQKLFGRR